MLPSVKEVYMTQILPFYAPGASLNLQTTLQAKKRIFNDPDWHHEYRPSALGSQTYRDLSANLLFGRDHRLLQEKR